MQVEADPKLTTTTTPTGTPLSFAADIVSLFRADVDRPEMLFAFDLHRFEDVRDNAQKILGRLKNKTMPCDGPWRPEQMDLFERWIEEGMQP